MEKDLETLIKEKREKNSQDFQAALKEAMDKYKCELIPKVTIVGKEVVAEIIIQPL